MIFSVTSQTLHLQTWYSFDDCAEECTEMKQVDYNKLVRDRIPEIIAAAGDRPKTQVLDEDEYIHELRRKLVEEVEEFNTSCDAEELVDILEVVYAIASRMGIDPIMLDKLRNAKKEKRGGFEAKVFLIHTESDDERNEC